MPNKDSSVERGDRSKPALLISEHDKKWAQERAKKMRGKS